MTKNRPCKSNPVTTATEKIPLVSVIIPVFNAAKFLAQTLESLLCQTMTDFEVIAVDDCSTDNSVAVAESFASHFNGRLKIVKLATNSGTPDLPRNVGIQASHGKYFTFLDDDDFFTPTALEELSTLAEEFQADVVHTDDFYAFDATGKNFATFADLLREETFDIMTCRQAGAQALQRATDAPKELAERIKLWLNGEFQWATWSLFVRKDFWTANKLAFPRMRVSGDTLGNFYCLCLANNLLRVPNVTYIHRGDPESITNESADAEKYLRKWLSDLTVGFREFAAFMDGLDFFREKIGYRYAVLNWFFEKFMRDAQRLPFAYAQIHPALLARIVEKEFSSDDAALAAYLFNVVNLQRFELAKLQRQ